MGRHANPLSVSVAASTEATRQKARKDGCVVTDATARAATLDFRAFDYCEQNGIHVPVGSFPPPEVYAAISGHIRPRMGRRAFTAAIARAEKEVER